MKDKATDEHGCTRIKHKGATLKEERNSLTINHGYVAFFLSVFIPVNLWLMYGSVANGLEVLC